MSMLREGLIVAGCIWILACGPSEPPSPLILGGNPADAAPGPRSLTSSQTRALRQMITAAGEPCDSIELTYLRDVDAVAGAESWDVRCVEDVYMVMIPADGRPSAVQRCPDGLLSEVPCRQRYRGQRYSDRRPAAPLNPDLGKLLEPMTAKDGKTD